MLHFQRVLDDQTESVQRHAAVQIDHLGMLHEKHAQMQLAQVRRFHDLYHSELAGLVDAEHLDASGNLQRQQPQIPTELRLQIETLSSDLATVMSAVSALQNAISAQRQSAQTTPEVDQAAKRVSDDLDDIKRLLNWSPLDDLLARRHEQAGEAGSLHLLSFDYSRIHRQVLELNRRREEILSEFSTSALFASRELDIDRDALAPRWATGDADALPGERLDLDDLLDENRIRTQVDKKISQVLFENRFDDHRGSSTRSGIPGLPTARAPGSLAARRIGAVSRTVINPGEPLLPSGLAGTTDGPPPRRTAASPKKRTASPTKPVAFGSSAPRDVLADIVPPPPPPSRPAAKPIGKPKPRRPAAAPAQIATPQPTATALSSPGLTLEHRPQQPPRPQPHPLQFESDSAATSSAASSPPRPASPGRPPNFYNVRLANAPVFLRRTSIRPPTLDFLDHTMRRLDQIRSPQRSAGASRSASPVRSVAMSPIRQERFVSTASGGDGPADRAPAAAPPDHAPPAVHRARTFDEAAQTMPVVQSVATQVTPRSSTAEPVARKPIRAEVATDALTDRCMAADQSLDAATAGHPRTVAVQYQSPDRDASVQYSTPDDSVRWRDAACQCDAMGGWIVG
nr:hypothetical protein HK105_002864 [Polyrhizophydium stewartii]